MVKATKSEGVQGCRETTKRSVILRGLTDIMFDRYAGDNQTQLDVWQKLYLMADAETLCLPSLNIISFLSAENTKSAPRTLMNQKEYKRTALACRNYISISPHVIPFVRDSEPIKIGTMSGESDPLSGVYIHRAVARLDKGIPNPKVRPVLPAPWELHFSLTLLRNPELQEQRVRWLFEEGGIAIGLGTFRGAFGKFEISKWE